MYKNISKLITIILCGALFLMSFKTFAISVKYTDYDTNLSFIISECWNQEKVYDGTGYVKAKFTPIVENGDVVVYMSADIYSELTATEKGGITRKEIDNAFFSNKDIADMIGEDESRVYTASIDDVEYYRLNTTQLLYGEKVLTTYFIRLYNGYLFIFQFSTLGNINNEGFNRMMSSVDYSNVASKTSSDSKSQSIMQSTVVGLVWLEIVIGTLLGFSLYSLPIIIYVFVLKKPRLTRKKAKKAAIIYAVCSFIVLLVIKLLIGDYDINIAPAFICAYINYRILAGDKIENASQLYAPPPSETYVPENMTIKINMSNSTESNYSVTEEVNSKGKNNNADIPVCSSPNIMFCHKCGQKLTEGDLFCQHCGVKLNR